ncbi:MAG: hypothetical protein RLZZ511_4155 [Cyanobacteriota bacterium]|jgi:hypothetical protein
MISSLGWKANCLIRRPGFGLTIEMQLPKPIQGVGDGTMLYGIQDVAEVLGVLRSIFVRCIEMLEAN